MSITYEIHKSETKDGPRYWVREVAANGEPLTHSEQLGTHQAAVANARVQGATDKQIVDKTGGP